MPSRLIRTNLDLLAPFVVLPLLNVLAECEARGKSYVAYSGFRSFKDQKKLWLQGRTQPGPRVTNAGPGYSIHNYGMAIDCYLDDALKPGLQPVWTNNKGEYALLKEVGEKHGFQVGVPSVPGGDPGHLQIPIAKLFGKKEIEVLRSWVARKAEGKDVWQEVEDLWVAHLKSRS